ncbi:PilZ domain-containing protein [Pseudomonas typographi]|uniref:Cyclic diguanosine monophosphate-binding protein n=1 Tax=Pseudomonas typographi TaxID=2715964 RepID=A0ABR7YXT2_9PSED|nr:PilZ domain-containing protein [Pseudomonas typographi]MBD1588009.1 PilZ domain-containing protein [Pseudomonas typographi]MBD1597997.1 PilZ domain-containing protein [Pseudomonas typographi]
MTDERRRFIRIPFDAHTLIAQGGTTWPVQLLDVSLKGLLVERPEDWAGDPAQPFGVQIDLGEQVTVKMEVWLKHEEAERLGFQCGHIDLDSASHLRRLVELNLGDAAQLERELAALLRA